MDIWAEIKGRGEVIRQHWWTFVLSVALGIATAFMAASYLYEARLKTVEAANEFLRDRIESGVTSGPPVPPIGTPLPWAAIGASAIAGIVVVGAISILVASVRAVRQRRTKIAAIAAVTLEASTEVPAATLPLAEPGTQSEPIHPEEVKLPARATEMALETSGPSSDQPVDPWRRDPVGYAANAEMEERYARVLAEEKYQEATVRLKAIQDLEKNLSERWPEFCRAFQTGDPFARARRDLAVLIQSTPLPVNDSPLDGYYASLAPDAAPAGSTREIFRAVDSYRFCRRAIDEGIEQATKEIEAYEEDRTRRLDPNLRA